MTSPFPCCPANWECAWKKTQVEKKNNIAKYRVIYSSRMPSDSLTWCQEIVDSFKLSEIKVSQSTICNLQDELVRWTKLSVSQWLLKCKFTLQRKVNWYTIVLQIFTIWFNCKCLLHRTVFLIVLLVTREKDIF